MSKKNYSFEHAEGSAAARVRVRTRFGSPADHRPSELFRSIQNNDLFGVRRLVQQNISINSIDSSGYSALARAVGEGNKQIVDYLVKKGADVCKVGSGGKTPLSVATEKEDLEVVRLLLDHGGEADIQSAFLVAIETKNLSVIQFLKEAGAVVNFTYSDGCTPLIKAMEVGDARIVQYLIDNGANTGDILDNQKLFVMKFVVDNNYDMVQLMARIGVNLDSPNHEGDTPLMKAAELGNLAMVKVLVEEYPSINKVEALNIAVSKGYSEIIEYLTEAGAVVVDPTQVNLEESVTLGQLW